MTTLFLTGIDTDIGKSIACGALANTLIRCSKDKVFTQKWVETGTSTNSQDLQTHQDIAQTAFNTGSTEQHSPYRFKYPASPHLSARLEHAEISCGFLAKQTQQLETHCDHLIIEGAGGLCVPLNSNTLLIDLIEQLKLPIILVTSAKLGSINHTLLSLQACQQRDIEVRAVLYNHYPEQNGVIFADTRDYLQQYLSAKHIDTLWLELATNSNKIDISEKQINFLLR